MTDEKDDGDALDEELEQLARATLSKDALERGQLAAKMRAMGRGGCVPEVYAFPMFLAGVIPPGGRRELRAPLPGVPVQISAIRCIWGSRSGVIDSVRLEPNGVDILGGAAVPGAIFTGRTGPARIDRIGADGEGWFVIGVINTNTTRHLGVLFSVSTHVHVDGGLLIEEER